MIHSDRVYGRLAAEGGVHSLGCALQGLDHT
jgi:hypothetical protein